MAIVGTLLVELSANVARLRTDMETATRLVEQQTSRMSAAAEGVKKSLAAIGAGIGVGSIMHELIGRFTEATHAMAELDDAAEKTGASVEELSAIFNTLAPTGATLENITDVAQKLAKSMREAGDEGSAQARAFAALSVATKDADGNFRSTGAVLEDVARSLAGYADGTNKTAIAQILLGKSGADALPMLKDLATRHKENATVTADAAADAERLSNAWRELKRNGELTAQSIASQIIPELARLSEQFIATGKAGGSMWEQIRSALGPNKFAAELQSDLDSLLEKRRQIEGDTRPLMQRSKPESLAAIDRQIEETQAKLARLRGALRIANGPSGKEALYGEAGYGEGKPPAPVVNENAAAAKAAADRKFEADRLLETLTNQLAVARQLTTEQQVLGRIGRGEIEGLTPTLEQQILLRAVQIDKEKQLAEEIKKATEQETQDYQALNKLSEEARRGTEAEVKAILDAVDPTRKLYAELERVKELLANGLIPDDVGNARIMALYSQIDGILLKIPDKVEEASSAIKDLGFEFQSAFEQAVIGGAKLSTVLSGLAQDVAKYFLRQQITGPLLSMLGGTFDSAKQGSTIFGALYGSITGAISGKAVGGAVSGGTPYLVGERGPELMVPQSSGTIIPAGQFGGVTIHQTVNVGSGVNRNDVATAMIAAKNAAKAEILQSMRRGGAYAVT